MSNYEFLKEVGIDGTVCWMSEPTYFDDGNFSVLITDSEGWNGFIMVFDKDGNYIGRS